MRNGILPGTFVEVCLHSAVNKYLKIFFFHTALMSLSGRLSLDEGL